MDQVAYELRRLEENLELGHVVRQCPDDLLVVPVNERDVVEACHALRVVEADNRGRAGV